MKFESTLERLPSNVWDICFFVPDEYSERLIEGKDRRVVCKLNNELVFHCALMPSKLGGYFINTNKEIRKKLNLELGSKVSVELKKDTSKYGMPMPEEFEELLSQDELGNQVFHSLTIGKQRTLIHLVGKLKSSSKRVEKAIVILEYLVSVDGKLDFKELNEAFKNSRFR